MSGPGVCLQGLPGSSQPSLALVELTRPDQRAGEHYQRGRDHRFGCPKPCRSASAIASRQRRCVVANEWRTSDANPSCARQPTSR